MQVYKVFFKVIQKNLGQISIYLGIFLFFSVILSQVSMPSQVSSFTKTKFKIAFINYDENSKLVQGLKDYLSKNTTIVDISDDAQTLQDALFFRQVECIIKVPNGFSKNLLDGKESQLQKTTVPNSMTGMYMDIIINKYLNTARTYINNVENISDDQLLNNIEKDLTEEVQVKVSDFGKQTTKGEKTALFFNYLAYSLFAAMILGVCSVMIVFNKTDLKRRNLCSPLKLKNINKQLILGNLSFATISWLIMITGSVFLFGSYMFTFEGLLFLLNSFIFTMAILSISFLIGNFIKSPGAMSAAANVVALGSSFISGVFVPQYLLGKTVLNIASFTPTYWYIKSNDQIANLSNYKMENLLPIFNNMNIVLAFAIAVISITLVVIKQKRQEH